MHRFVRALGAFVVATLVAAGLAVGVSGAAGAAEERPTGARGLEPPVLTGTGVVGEPLTVLLGGLPTTFPVQWQRDGSTVVGAGSTYVPTLDDAGHTVSAIVTLPVVGAVTAGAITILAPTATTPDPPGLPDLLSGPALSGDAVVGGLLTITAPVFSAAGVTTTYTWLRDGVAVPGASGDTYVPGVEDAGHRISALVTSTFGGVTLLETVTDALAIPGVGGGAGGTVAATAAPTVTAGSAGPKVGRLLATSEPTWNQDGVTTTYQWLRDGAPISGATTRTYTLVPEDVGAAVSVRATGTKDGFTDGVATSNAITALIGDAITPSSQPQITGAGQVGRLLTVDPGEWGPGTAPAFAYQWRRDDRAIPGAVAQTYQVDAADIGSQLTVTVTAVRPGYRPGTFRTSAVTVEKLTSRLGAKLASKSVRKGRPAVLKLVLRVPGVGSPTGPVTILDRGKVLTKKAFTTRRRGRVTVRLRGLKPGVHRLKAVYAGSSTVTGATSRAVRLRVRR